MPDAAPDWGAVPGDIVCPLCEYNLRGLTEPRCPECGYRFEWADLLEADNRRHPYLFEEHPQWNLGSFLRTMLGGLRPRKFWASLKPSHRPVPRRLALYWALMSGLLLFGWAVFFTGKLFIAERAIRAERVEFVRGALRANPAPNTAAGTRWAASVQKLAEFNYPSVLNVDGARDMLFHGASATLTRSALLCLIWPAATFVTLMIFMGSMRKAKVRGVHVLRCVVYSSDFGICLGWLPAAFLSHDDLHNVEFGVENGVATLLIVAAAVALITCYRLSNAYQLYLKFDHPWAAVVASQLIVLLLACIVAMNLPEGF